MFGTLSKSHESEDSDSDAEKDGLPTSAVDARGWQTIHFPISKQHFSIKLSGKIINVPPQKQILLVAVNPDRTMPDEWTVRGCTLLITSPGNTEENDVLGYAPTAGIEESNDDAEWKQLGQEGVVRIAIDPNVFASTLHLPVVMDKSRGFRHELLLRVGRAKFGTEPFRPFCNTTDDLRTCVQCGKMRPKMRRCSGCKWARYCDRVCQQANWRTHRTECCPDHSLPTGIRTIPYPLTNVVCQSCPNIEREFERRA